MKAQRIAAGFGLMTGLLFLPWPAPAQQIDAQLALAPDPTARPGRNPGQLEDITAEGHGLDRLTGLLASAGLDTLAGDDSLTRAIRCLADPGFSLHRWFDDRIAPRIIAAEGSIWERFKLRTGVALLARSDLVAALWSDRREAALRAIAALDVAGRRRLAAALDESVYAFSAFMLDPDGVRHSLQNDETAAGDGKAAAATGGWLARRLERLHAAADKVRFADDLWQLGGEPLLGRALRLADDLRSAARDIHPPPVTASR